MVLFYRDLPAVPKLWGTERWLVNTDDYCCKVLELHDRAVGSLHFHRLKDEVFYVVEGRVELEVTPDPAAPRRTLVLEPGHFYRVRPLCAHRFRALTPTALVLEASTHHDDADTVRLEAAR